MFLNLANSSTDIFGYCLHQRDMTGIYSSISYWPKMIFVIDRNEFV